MESRLPGSDPEHMAPGCRSKHDSGCGQDRAGDAPGSHIITVKELQEYGQEGQENDQQARGDEEGETDEILLGPAPCCTLTENDNDAAEAGKCYGHLRDRDKDVVT